MNRIFRTFFIFLLLLTTRNAVAVTVDTSPVKPVYYVNQTLVDDLDSLLNLASTSGTAPQQETDSLQQLFERAPLAQTELSNLLNNISQESHTHILMPEIKSYQRAQQKIERKFNGDASFITDIARATLVADDVETLMRSYDALAETTEVVQVKNRFADPKASGYRDLNLLVKLPQTKMIVEVQLHLSKIAEIKSGPEHQVYEQIQHIEAVAQTQHRALTDLELMQIVKLRQSSHKLYHKAWLSYKRQSLAQFDNTHIGDQTQAA
ncbi:RelA/SpoT domain-containing protein [Shewanella sp. 10N.7]|uniref:RelA/SpoT domain-containing protein n=1 Tax=Shewanella sp. 10N.7 TaxID=2885093 RepID=UPI001E580184|nr:RelA/SpoT domain-containing protein [Shewanella sp. 10N.7]MCC4832777.1 RelA/SpoT domain-containing protein [Shewanella sp. 10N.7]